MYYALCHSLDSDSKAEVAVISISYPYINIGLINLRHNAYLDMRVPEGKVRVQ